MKKYIFTLIFVLSFSLGLLFVFENKPVSAYEIPAYYDVEFSLTQQQIDNGITWFETGTTETLHARFYPSRGVEYYISSNISDIRYLFPNKDNELNDFNNLSDWDWTSPLMPRLYFEVNYNGVPTIFTVTSFDDIYWFLELSITQDLINPSIPFKARWAYNFNYIFSQFIYRDSATLNEDNSYTYTTRTTPFYYINIFPLAQWVDYQEDTSTVNLKIIPLSYGDETFTSWNINRTSYLVQDLYSTYFNAPFVATAEYSANATFVVEFYNGLNLLGANTYPSGKGTIVPPNFTFLAGQELVGWSTSLGGQPINLSQMHFAKDVKLYAVLEFNSGSTGSGGKFDIPYQDCSQFDFVCHFSNGWVYLLNELPLISDIASFIYPIGDFLVGFVDDFYFFENLGLIFYISMGVLFITFIFKMLR